MTFGDPIIYYCPLCNKPAKMTTYRSYSVHRSDIFSDGFRTGKPHFTPDLAKCPNCKALFFRHNDKNKKEMSMTAAKKIRDIEDPSRDDLVKNVTNKKSFSGLAKTRQEKKTLREDLWRNLNNDTRRGYNALSGELLEIWKDNCAALFPLTEKTLEEMRLKKNSVKYSDDDRDNCLIMTAELNRNLGYFNRCKELVNQLNKNWGWLKKQYNLECKAKNIFTFELLSQRELNLEKDEKADKYDYFNRGKKYLAKFYGRRDVKKALADFNKAQELGLSSMDFYRERGLLYLYDFHEPDNAIADLTKALKQSEGFTKALVLCERCNAYFQKGSLKKALTDIQAAIDTDSDFGMLYGVRSVIRDAMGNKQAAELDRFKENILSLKTTGTQKDRVFPLFNVASNLIISHNTTDTLVINICEEEVKDKPVEPEILYGNGADALFRRRPDQFVLLYAIYDVVLKDLNNTSEVIIKEKGHEYPVKVRNVLEPLDTLQSIIEDGYPFFTSLRALLYQYKNKPIKKLIPKEDWPTLACILVREEDYEQLERYASEGLPLNETTPAYFRPFQPTPLYYAVMGLIWKAMKDPVKMLNWLAAHGADVNKPSGDKTTPLGNQCYANGDILIIKTLLEAGADPNAQTFINDTAMTPYEMMIPVLNYETDPSVSEEDRKQIKENFSAEQIENLKKIAALLAEYGAKTNLGNETKTAAENQIQEIDISKTEEKEFVVFDAWTEVAGWQFARDSTYTSFVMGDSIISIGKCAFAHCKNLKKLDIGKNVKYIEKFAFRKDNRPGEMADITEVINRSITPQMINRYHFHNNDLSKAVLHVPEQSITAYQKAEGWKNFGSIVALDENKYPAQTGEFFGRNKNAGDKRKTGKKTKKKDEPETSSVLHVWLGNFESEKELDEYADNSEYEWEYYGHLLGEDNFDEPPEEYGIGCGFSFDYGFKYEEAADITDNLFWEYFKKEKTLYDIFNFLPVDHSEIMEACKKKYSGLEKVNSYIVLFGHPKKQKIFEKTKTGKPCFYLGMFEIPQKDTDGQYEAWD